MQAELRSRRIKWIRGLCEQEHAKGIGAVPLLAMITGFLIDVDDTCKNKSSFQPDGTLSPQAPPLLRQIAEDLTWADIGSVLKDHNWMNNLRQFNIKRLDDLKEKYLLAAYIPKYELSEAEESDPLQIFRRNSWRQDTDKINLITMLSPGATGRLAVSE